MEVYKRKEQSFTHNRVKKIYYQCEVCGRQITSEEYYMYGKCNNCRW